MKSGSGIEHDSPASYLNTGSIREEDFFQDAYAPYAGALEDRLLASNGQFLGPSYDTESIFIDTQMHGRSGTSPSPPESHEVSPKSSNTSPRSSNSSPPQVKLGENVEFPLEFAMNDNDFDFPMLEEDTANLDLVNALSSGTMGTIDNASLMNQKQFEGMDLDGVNEMNNDLSARYFDFESAASSPLGIGQKDIMAQKVPRVFNHNGMNAFAQGNVMRPTPTGTIFEQNSNISTGPASKKRRSDMSDFSSFSPSGVALNFDTTAHPSPSSSQASGIRRMSNFSKPSPSSSSDEEPLQMRNNRLGSVANMWSPSSTSFFPVSPMATGISLGFPVTLPEQAPYSLTLRGDQPGNRIHEKSRVETQIRVNLNLTPLPAGVTKLHLPTHTISKPKLLAKPVHEKSPDTLEVYTSLICASSVNDKPDLLMKAMQRAAEDPLQERSFRMSQESDRKISTADLKPGESIDNKDLFVTCEEDKPLNGGEVRICSGCIVRERKRAARKKVKRVDEEETWAKDEGRRIIVFNCAEIIDWTPPDKKDDNGRMVSVDSQDGAAEVWLPIRIACYCRHQGEKTGFRIIFTIKDHNDNLIAQSITSPILITDDHKTTIATAGTGNPNNQPTFSVGASPPDAPQGLPSYSGTNGNSNIGYSQSDTNLVGLAHNSSFGRQTTMPTQNTQTQSRQHSRQSSMSGPSQPHTNYGSGAATVGPSAKKRKSSAGKVRNELAMTKLERSPPVNFNQMQPFSPASSNPFSAGPPSYDGTSHQFGVSGPPTPLSESANNMFAFHNRSQSMENLQGIHNMFSAPTSTQASRVPSRATSPTLQQSYSITQARQAQYQQAQQQQFAQAAHNALASHLNNGQMPFDISRIVPTEGPCRGGIEVTILGSHFHRSHEVVFGDVVAPKTEFWSDSTMVCLLPPSAIAGPVQVSLRNATQPQVVLAGRGKPFTYNDDTEHKMLALALQVINAKWSGKVEAPKDIAMRLLVDEHKGQGNINNMGPSSNQGRQVTNQAQRLLGSGGTLDIESQMLKLLDIIDMDDSPFPAKLNLRNRQGQTMLHFACSLGLSRFVAGLLARGANPVFCDRGGYTPMHFAALHNHADLVRRLKLNHADVHALTMSGLTPADMAASTDVTVELVRGPRSRRGSAASISSAPGRFSGRRSRSGSVASNHSAWDGSQSFIQSPDNIFDSPPAAFDDDDADLSETEELWIRPRPSRGSLRSKNSGLSMTPRVLSDQLMPPSGALPVPVATATPPAALAAFATAWRDNFANLSVNLPTWSMPNTPGAQLFPNPIAVFNTLIAQANSRGATDQAGKEGEYRWRELFTNPAPPAYEELFPNGETAPGTGFPDEKSQLLEAALEKMSLQTQTQPSAESSTTSTKPRNLSEADVTELLSQGLNDKQEEVLKVHVKKLQRIKGDRRLFFFWIPILLVIAFALLHSWASQTFVAVRTTYEVVKERMAETVPATTQAATAQAAQVVVGS